MRVFVTKYALTAGIEVQEVEYDPGTDDRKYVYTTERYRQQFVMGRDAFPTYKEATVAARAMRDKKELSLKKQLKKISGLIFNARMPDNLRTKL